MGRKRTQKCKNFNECSKYLYPGNITGYCANCLREKREKDRIEHWLATGDSGHQPISMIKGPVRRYMYKDQNNCCAICGMTTEWNGKELRFVLDHINGNAADNRRENLRLVCPNCDSQLDTFKFKNKNSARKYRKPKANNDQNTNSNNDNQDNNNNNSNNGNNNN